MVCMKSYTTRVWLLRSDNPGIPTEKKFIRVPIHCFRAVFCQTSALKPIRRPNSRFIRYSDYFWQLPGNFLLNYQLLLVIAQNFFRDRFWTFCCPVFEFFYWFWRILDMSSLVKIWIYTFKFWKRIEQDWQVWSDIIAAVKQCRNITSWFFAL